MSLNFRLYKAFQFANVCMIGLWYFGLKWELEQSPAGIKLKVSEYMAV